MTTTNTATDVAERLPRLLDELARSTPTQSEHPPFNPNVSMLLDDSRDAHRPRRLAAAAAVVLLIAGAGALAFARPGNPGTSPAAATPSGTAATPNDPEADTAQRVEPTLFPAIDQPPAGWEVTARIEAIPASSMFTEALIARSDGAVITDSVAITVQAEPFEISPMAGKAPTTTEVFGKPATVYDYGVEVAIPVVHVTWGAGPYFLATGSDPVAFLAAADSDTFAAVSDAGAAPVLTIGELPEGYAVIAEPTVVGRATTSATLSIGADNYDISVSTRNLIGAMAQAGSLRRVEVNGADGWMFNTTGTTDVALTQDVAWKVDATTYAYLKVNDGTNAEDALALARRITFLDRNSWTARYLPYDTTAAADALSNGSVPNSTGPIDSVLATPATTGPAANVPAGPRASLDLPGWTLTAADTGDGTTIGAEYRYASADGKSLQINFYPGTLADRGTNEFPDDAVDVLSESQQVAAYPNGSRFRYNAALTDLSPGGLDWVMEVDGEPFADQDEFMAAVRAIRIQ
jgi:hypothetical protein